MAEFHTTNPQYTPDYLLGRGKCFFSPFDAAGRTMGEVDLGECSAVALSIAPEEYKHKSKRNRVATTDLSVVLSVEFSASIEFENFNADNWALLLAGAKGTVTQTGASVTAERIYNAISGREYQLGASDAQPSGVRSVSAVSVYLHELKNASARVNSTPYVAGDIFKSSTNVFLVTTGGTTAGSAPSFVTTSIGAATTDGTAEVKFLGTTAAFTADTDYTLSADAARVAILTGADLADACDLYTSETGEYLSLSVAYTSASVTWQKIESTTSGNLAGQFRYIADNARGTNRDLFISSCTLAPSGDIPLISDEAAKASFNVGVNLKNAGTPQIRLDGRVLA